MGYTVYLKKGEEKRIVAGHSWLYANEVAKIEGKDKNGSLATVVDYSGRYIGKGYINHLSKILVRIFIRNDEDDTKELFLSRIAEADNYRKKLGYSDCYRMVFAEADNLPALIVDKYADVLCIQILSLGTERKKDLIVDCLKQLFNPKGIYERSDVAVREKEGLPLYKGKIYGDFDTRVHINENGVKMIADLENGQKTGYFLDQKENRFAIRRYCNNATVLDCFCNVGGFSMNAVKGGAKSVIALDISEKALNDVKEIANLNGYSDKITAECGDVFEKLRDYKKQGKRFNVVILDPPAFCKSAAEVKNAYKGYKDINILAMKIVESGGFLATCSCSHYMTRDLFEKMLKEAAEQSGRTVRLIESRVQAPDHPSLLAADETAYLKFYVLQIN